MCESGIDESQFDFSVNQINETLALAQEWTEQLHHVADRAQRSEASVQLAQVSVMLGEAREKLESAVGGVGGSSREVTVERL